MLKIMAGYNLPELVKSASIADKSVDTTTDNSFAVDTLVLSELEDTNVQNNKVFFSPIVLPYSLFHSEIAQMLSTKTQVAIDYMAQQYEKTQEDFFLTSKKDIELA